MTFDQLMDLIARLGLASGLFRDAEAAKDGATRHPALNAMALAAHLWVREYAEDDDTRAFREQMKHLASNGCWHLEV